LISTQVRTHGIDTEEKLLRFFTGAYRNKTGYPIPPWGTASQNAKSYVRVQFAILLHYVKHHAGIAWPGGFAIYNVKDFFDRMLAPAPAGQRVRIKLALYFLLQGHVSFPMTDYSAELTLPLVACMRYVAANPLAPDDG